ncbi:MAG: cation diffusion facilitator family transporter [Acidobacteria bacterium]|nr:cation diffusion facilitator family transporter [Acidobacteriota bacterium]
MPGMIGTVEGIREKKIAALASVGTALTLVSLKVFLTWYTGSLGVLSEALHSGLDLVAAIITYLSVRISDRPADADHTYGHAKVESFSAFVQTGLLLLTALYVIYEAFHRLFTRSVHLEPSLIAIAVLAGMAGMDVIRSRALGKVARKHQSEALEADALHFSTDVWSTLVVMFGMICAWVGQKFDAEWLYYADPLAALFVAGVIIWVGSQLGRRTLDALLDAAPAGLPERITTAVAGVEGVIEAGRVRVRRAGKHHFVDVTISVPRTASFEQVHAISDAVEKRVEQIVPADVMVHMEPRAQRGETLFDAIRAMAHRRGLAIHEISAHQVDGRLFIEMHMEVEEHLSLREAHRRATELEEEVLLEGDGVAGVNIHIEPLGEHIAAAGVMQELAAAVQGHVNSLCAEYSELLDCHQVLVREADQKIIVSCHCAMDGSLPITQIHDVTEALQDRIKEKFPQIFEVNIHPEPVEES